MNWLDDFGRGAAVNVDVWGLLLNLVLVLGLGQMLAWHYQRFAQVLSNKRKFARMFVFVAATTLLMITVVKTSLALSLGLVGALSIIRFRTPIKEPEELAYLFLSIALGVGLGADQRTVTLIVFGALLIMLSLRRSGASVPGMPTRTVVQVTAALVDMDGGQALSRLRPAIEQHSERVDLRRVDTHDGELHVSFLVDIVGADSVANMLSQVPDSLPGASVSVIEYEGVE